MSISILETNVVRQSVSMVISQSSSVSIISPEIHKICSSLDVTGLTDSSWDFDFTEHYDTRTRLILYLLFNSINFSFWDIPRWSIEYYGKVYTGSYGLMAALVRSLKDGAPILEPRYLINISSRDVDYIFRGNRTIPMLDERMSILRELGNSLIEHDIKNLKLLFPLDPCNLQKIIDSIAEIFPSFNDVARLGNINVYFYKRAQLLVAQSMKLIMGAAFNRFADFFTVFADYRLPQALRGMGVIQYNSALSERIDNGEILKRGSLEEIEIRCNTIWAAELFRRELNSTGINVNSIQIDSWLWKYAKKFDNTLAPHHRVKTTFY